MIRRSLSFLRLLSSVVLGLVVLACGAIAQAQTIDFDGETPGNVVTALPPVHFTHSEPGVDLVVSTGMPSTSMANYLGAAYQLGASDDDQDLFQPGDVLTITLDAPANSIAVSVVSTPGTRSGAFELATPQGSVVSDPGPNQFVGFDEVFFLSLSSAVPFTTAELRATDDVDALFAFHVDDVFVPEPGAGAMLAAGVLGLAGGAARRRVSPRRR